MSRPGSPPLAASTCQSPTARRLSSGTPVARGLEPQQISLWLAQEEQIFIRHEWICLHVLEDKRHGGDLHGQLRRKRYVTHAVQLPSRVSIDQRQALVQRRIRLGGWEFDSIIGKGHAGIVSLAERKSRLALIRQRGRGRQGCRADVALSLIRTRSYLLHP